MHTEYWKAVTRKIHAALDPEFLVVYSAGDIHIDGHFSVDELERIIAMVKEAKENEN